MAGWQADRLMMMAVINAFFVWLLADHGCNCIYSATAPSSHPSHPPHSLLFHRFPSRRLRSRRLISSLLCKSHTKPGSGLLHLASWPRSPSCLRYSTP
jgi:hypothetical protein